MSNNPPRVPRKTAEFVSWLKPRGPAWKLNNAALGLTTLQGTNADAAATAIFTAYDARLAAEQAFRAAVATLDTALDSARSVTGDCMRTIDAFASNAPDPTVIYNLAEFPAPSAPKPAPPPGLPSDLRVTLGQTGTLELAWKIAPTTGGGVVYEVKRSLGSATGPFEYLGVVGTRKFNDDTLPSGNATVFYQVTGVRSTQRGPSAVFMVRFGTGEGVFSITSVSTGEMSGKLAA